MNIDQILSSVLASTNASNKNLSNIAGMQGKLAQQVQTTSAQNTAEARSDIPVASAIAQQQAAVDAQKAQTIQELQIAANLNPAEADNAYVRGLADLQSINTAREAAHAELTQLATTNLLDDPIGFVLAQLNLPVAQARAEALDKQAARTVSDVNNRITMLANAKSTLTADTVQQVKQIQLGQAALAAREAARKLSQQELENNARVAGHYLQQAQTLDKINDNTRQMFSMQMQAAQFQQSQEAMLEARQERNLRMEELLAAKKLREDEDAMLTASLAAASKLLGYPEPVSIAFFKRMPSGEQKTALANLAASHSLGDNLFDAFGTFVKGGGSISGLQKGGNIGLAKFMSGIDKTMDIYIADARKPDKTGKFPSDKEAHRAGAYNYQQAVISAAVDPRNGKPLTSTEWDSRFNPYRQHLGLLDNAMSAGKVPRLVNNQVYIAMKNAAAAATTPDGNISAEGEQIALRTVAQLVADGKLSAADAARDMANYYKSAAAVNADFYQYTVAGFPLQDSYMARVRVPGLISDSVTKSYNLMNETQAKMMLMEIAKQSQPPTMNPQLEMIAPSLTTGAEAAFKWAP